MSTYAIGDIQGCYNEFQELLRLINYDPAADELWLCGDLINRGPDNVKTIELVMSLENTRPVLGNHDLHFLAVATGVHRAFPSDTLTDLMDSDRLEEIIAWMRCLPLIHHDNVFDCILVHAGLPPIWSIEDAIAYAGEVELVLRSDSYQEFFRNMYGNLPAIWNDRLKGWDRLRVITNYLTRLRYCTADGEMELEHKADIQPAGYATWFSFSRNDDVPILFGHWAAIEGLTNQPQMIALDTGCVWGRQLTAYRLDDQRRFCVSAWKRST